jgi:hypothetical protein
MPGFTMQRADSELILTDERIQKRRFARADAAENSEMQVPVLELLEHGLHGFVIVRQ